MKEQRRTNLYDHAQSLDVQLKLESDYKKERKEGI
jgi:hypothetical protein